HQHRHVRRREGHLPHADAQAGRGRLRQLEDDARRRSVRDRSVDFAAQQGAQRRPPGACARHLAAPHWCCQFDGGVHRSHRQVTARSWWGWGTDEAAVTGAELTALTDRVAALLPDADLTDHPPPAPDDLDLPAPRIAAPDALAAVASSAVADRAA